MYGSVYPFYKAELDFNYLRCEHNCLKFINTYDGQYQLPTEQGGEGVNFTV